MRVLIVSQYFWPENFRVNEIASFLQNKNIKVDILTGQPNYPEGKIFKEFKQDPKKYNDFNGSKVIRVPIITRRSGSHLQLFLNYTSFLLSSMIIGVFKLRKKKYDCIITFGTSPITVALTSLFLSKIKRTKTLVWVLDLWPSILVDLNIVKNRLLLNILTKITNFTYIKHDVVLAQSKSFLDQIIKYNKNTIYFPSWPETIEKIKLDNNAENIKLEKFKDYFKIVFTGNIGQAQGFEKIIKLAKGLKDENVVFIIVGKGRRFQYFEKLKKEENLDKIIFMGNYPLEKMSYFHEIADALIVTLSNGLSLNKTIPGKLSTYMMTGKPIIGIIEGEVKEIISHSDSGIHLDIDSDQYLNKIKNFIKLDKKELNRMGNNGINYSNLFYKKEKILSELVNTLNKLKLSDKYEINIIENSKEIPFHKNFVLSGLNLAFLGYWLANKINIYENLLHWPDGLFKNILYSNKLKKLPGRTLLKDIILGDKINNIIVAGNCSEKSKIYLDNKFKNINKTYIELPFDKPSKLEQFIPNLNEQDLLFLTLPTPKQEQVAEFLAKRSKFFKVICIGGGIEMASGNESPVPKYLENYGLETIYRLKTDTIRRSKRLIETLFFLTKGLFQGKLKKLDAKIYEKD